MDGRDAVLKQLDDLLVLETDRGLHIPIVHLTPGQRTFGFDSE